MYHKYFITLFTLGFLFLSGCQSTPKAPEWFSMTQNNDEQYLYAVGQGRTQSQAKKVAMNQINEQLWTQIQSQNIQREVYREDNGNGHYQNLVDTSINTQSARLTLTGIEYPKIEHNEAAYYVQARIKKSAIQEQLIRELKEMNRAADAEIAKLTHTDTLVWYLNNRSIIERKKEALIRIAILSAMEPEGAYSTQHIDVLVNKVSEIQNTILIWVVAEPNDKNMTRFIFDALSKEKINTTQKRNAAKVTHTIHLALDKRENKVGSAYITTIISSITTLNNKGKTIASDEIISSGNSVSNYQMSAEGASRHFKSQLDDKGLWRSLGFSL
nr:LPP20 family lipoprotein [Vibrio sp. HA2012]